jgi:eukaryotic-like serine/threonine-protein kinase
MAMQSGTHLGSYEILTPLGAGGMGEVYRARDAKLGRDVALKVLPEAFARDSERMARFQREAKVLASLNHPNIAAIYGFEDSNGAHALVMELVEGPTLADRITQRPIPIDEALRIAKQICEALEYAHERGIVHRDLKPANIKVTNDDAVKVLDFGLAKAIEPKGVSPKSMHVGDLLHRMENLLEGDTEATELAHSPTLSEMATRPGILLGTAEYMSPEQAKAKPVDRRADIWAFGCVLYEMLTCKRAFAGESMSETLAAVIKEEPDWSELPTNTPIRVRVLLQRCLQKDPKQRLRDIGDARISLDEVLSGAPDPGGVAPVQATAPLWRRWLLSVISALLFLATVLLAFLYFHQKPVTAQAMRFEISLPERTTGSGISVISPDGSKLVLVATGTDGVARLWIRSLDRLAAQALEGTEGVYGYPFWSPDSRFIAFFAQGKLKKMDALGGPPLSLCDASSVWGGAWNRDTIIFGTNTGTMQMPASGGLPSLITDGGFSVTPSFLPDGHHFVYLRNAVVHGTRVFGIYLGSLDTKPEDQPSKPLLPDYTFVAFASSSDPHLGYLVFVRGTTEVGTVGTLMAQPFDTGRLELAGDAIPIAERVSNTSLSVSATDVLVYVSGEQQIPASVVKGNVRGELTWFDRDGKILGTFGDPQLYRTLSLSPDGKRLAFEAPNPQDSNSRNIWLYEFARGIRIRLTLDSGWDTNPVWSPDGSHIAFVSTRSGDETFNLYLKHSSLSGEDQLLLKSNENKVVSSWSPDGRFLLYSDTGTPSHLWLFPADGGSERKPIQLEQSQFHLEMGRFSPDGRWIAYSSDESGRDEIYVRPFDTPSSDAALSAGGKSITEKWLVSRDGGTAPLWRRDGKELFYLSPDETAMAVDINTSGLFQAGTPKALFKAPIGVVFWEVSSDGKRFLMPAPSASGANRPFTVVLNWQAGLKK